MNSYSTEEEQIAALKKWWSENGSSLLIGIGVALAVVFGWKAYQSGVEQDKSEASMLYQQLVSAATQTQLTGLEEGSTVGYLATELKNNHQGSEYALYAALFIAKEKVAEGDYEAAISELNSVAENTEDSRLLHIVKARLARIFSVQGKHQEAITMLESPDAAFEASYLEITGDIKKRSGDEAGAIEAYKQAFELVKAQPQAQPLLAVKLSDLGINPDSL